MNEWININDRLPEPNQLVITWNGREHTISKYMQALTWKGYKFKFVNVMSGYGAWNDDVTYWMPFPKPPYEEERNKQGRTKSQQELHEWLEDNPR